MRQPLDPSDRLPCVVSHPDRQQKDWRRSGRAQNKVCGIGAHDDQCNQSLIRLSWLPLVTTAPWSRLPPVTAAVPQNHGAALPFLHARLAPVRTPTTQSLLQQRCCCRR